MTAYTSKHAYVNDDPNTIGSSRGFSSLEQTAFLNLEHAASLKGLLKPFKGKRELQVLAVQCAELLESLNKLAQEQVLPQATRYPFSLLPVRLSHQSTQAGTVFLRWRRVDRTKMGVDVWQELIANCRTPISMIDDLLAIEQQRIALNMQISLIHTIARQARECAEKMEQAEITYRSRLIRQSTNGS